MFIKNCYSAYLTIYILWLVSVAIIFKEEGFSFVQDMPWFLIFTSILVFFWYMKYYLAEDSKILFYHNINPVIKNIYLIVIVTMTVLMVGFS
jgi:hypothetical protein